MSKKPKPVNNNRHPTPGPWTLDAHGKVYSDTPDGRIIVCKPHCLPPVKLEESVANARLIAAAPALLAALERIVTRPTLDAITMHDIAEGRVALRAAMVDL